MKIKICGITNLTDALAAVEAGADMLGFNFYSKSPRYVTPEICSEICAQLQNIHSSIVTVGVFVNESPVKVAEVLRQTGIDLAQLSGDEAVGDLDVLRGKGFKVVRLLADSVADSRMGTDGLADFVTDSRIETDLVAHVFNGYVRAREGEPPVLLVDAAVRGAYGGTGKTANWMAAGRLAKRMPILLAGGLTPENVADAVRQVHPWGVDVASGVESSPGRKDPVRMRAFVQNARV